MRETMSPENKSVSLHDAVKLLLEADDIYPAEI